VQGRSEVSGDVALEAPQDFVLGLSFGQAAGATLIRDRAAVLKAREPVPEIAPAAALAACLVPAVT
jgi:hypothetical protein